MSKISLLILLVFLFVGLNGWKISRPFHQFLSISITAAAYVGVHTIEPTLADSRDVARIPTAGIIFKDTLKISAFKDPKVSGVTIYLSDFERPVTEKLGGDFFNDPSSSSLTCLQTGPIKVADNIDKSDKGEEVFEESKNLFFKQIRVNRVLDKPTNTLVYSSYTTRLDKGSDSNKSRFKSSLCAVHIPDAPIATASTEVPAQ